MTAKINPNPDGATDKMFSKFLKSVKLNLKNSNFELPMKPKL